MSDLKPLKDQLKSLVTQREMLEIEADAIHSELTSMGPNGELPPGLKGDLIDEEGFPRNDIDLYNVRNKRRRLAEINTDHKALMKTVEALTSRIFEIARTTAAQVTTIATEDNSKDSTVRAANEPTTLVPIAILDVVLDRSPANLAGIRNGDFLLKFGDITATDPNALQSIARLVGNSVSRTIDLLIKRNDELIEISLIPKTWGGRGLLGCHLTPYKR